MVDGVSLSKLPPEHSPIAQWQSTRLLIEWLLVRIQLGEQKDTGRIAWVFLYLRGRELAGTIVLTLRSIAALRIVRGGILRI